MWIFKIQVEPPPPINDEFHGEFVGLPRDHFVHVIAETQDMAFEVVFKSAYTARYTDKGYSIQIIHPILYKSQGPLLVSEKAKKRSTMYRNIADITGQRFKDSKAKCRL